MKQLHSIVQQTIKEEELIMDNLIHAKPGRLTSGQRIADKVARFGGSW